MPTNKFNKKNEHIYFQNAVWLILPKLPAKSIWWVTAGVSQWKTFIFCMKQICFKLKIECKKFLVSKIIFREQFNVEANNKLLTIYSWWFSWW